MSATQAYGIHPTPQQHHAYSAGHPQQHHMMQPNAHVPTPAQYAYQQPGPYHQAMNYGYAYAPAPHYGNAVVPSQTHPHPAHHYQPQPLPPLPRTAPPLAPSTSTQQAPHPPPRDGRGRDTTGQVAPIDGKKTKLTATYWEDMETLCFQVECEGICVARRQDNGFINGTKLLNVAKMTRGRRDGMLKTEKIREVVKVGPMHLKGVWIPFDRALAMANQESITEQVFPLFLEDINSLVTLAEGSYPGSGGRQAIASGRNSLPPALQQRATVLPTPPARPGMDRAHTMAGVPATGTSGSSYDLQGQRNPQPQVSATEAALSIARSAPTSPATTPPQRILENLHNYQTSHETDRPADTFHHPHQYDGVNSVSHYTSVNRPIRRGSQPSRNGGVDISDRVYGHVGAGLTSVPSDLNHVQTAHHVPHHQSDPNASPARWRGYPTTDHEYSIAPGSYVTTMVPKSLGPTLQSQSKKRRRDDADDEDLSQHAIGGSQEITPKRPRTIREATGA